MGTPMLKRIANRRGLAALEYALLGSLMAVTLYMAWHAWSATWLGVAAKAGMLFGS